MEQSTSSRSGGTRAQDESRLDEVAPAKVSGAGRPSRRHSRSSRAAQASKPTLGLSSFEYPSVGSFAPLNPNSVLRGKTDDEGAETARVLAAGLALALAGCDSDDGSGGGGAGTTANGTTTEDDGHNRY